MTLPTPPAPRPRVLIPVTINFTLRYVLRTGLLDRLRSTFEPVLALTWDDPAVLDDLQRQGVEALVLEPPATSVEVRVLLADLYESFTDRLASPSTAINWQRDQRDRSTRRRLGARVRRDLARFQQRRPGAEARSRARLDEIFRTDTNQPAYEAMLQDRRIDAVFSITPYAVQESVLLRAAAALDLALVTSILSFDNLTTRPALPVAFDRYLVWNRFNRDELLRGYPELPADRIAVVGPAQFDFYAQPRYVEPAAAWCTRLGVPADAPTILFGAGPPTIAPHEAQYVTHLLDGIADGRLPTGTLVVLRRHPHDQPDRWTRFRDHPAVRMDDPGPVGSSLRPGQAALGDAEIVSLCSTLAHTDVHVNVSSTLTLDGAFFGKPQIGPDYDVEGSRSDRRWARDLYRREHFIPIVASGGLEIPHAPDQLVAQAASALADPGRLEAERRAMLTAMCTYLDGACTDRVADELRAFFAASGPAAPAAP